MSDTNEPGKTPDATPTEALELADQQPIGTEPAPEPIAPTAAPAAANHTRTILEVVGGAVAVGLILVAGVFGFLVGHATGSDRDDRWEMTSSRSDLQDGPDAGAPLGGQQGQPGHGQRGEDQDRWMMPGMPGQDGRMMPGMPGQDGRMMPGMPGQDQQRGIDPDGDNWTGGQDREGTAPDQGTAPTPTVPQQS